MAKNLKCSDCGGRRSAKAVRERKPCTRCSHVEGRAVKASAIQERNAAWGNDRVARAAFVRERMQQTGCLAIEASRAWRAGAR